MPIRLLPGHAIVVAFQAFLGVQVPSVGRHVFVHVCDGTADLHVNPQE